MGYYTNFNLKVYDLSAGKDFEVDSAIFPQFDEDCLYDDMLNVQSLIEGSADSMKWYDHKIEMCQFSKNYSRLLFVLDGEGEEAGDIWRDFYLDGKSFSWKLPKPQPPEYEEIKDKLE